MSKLDIYCLTSKKFEFFKFLPKIIKPLILGKDNSFHKNILNENNGLNLSHYNSYYAELTGIYWVYKNKMNFYESNDWIGFCHYRRLWLNDLYSEKHSYNNSIFSKLLNDKVNSFSNNESLMLQPIKFKNENLYEHFINNHGSELLNKSFSILENKISLEFQSYLQQKEFSICNMFITQKKNFINYCEFLFPFLDKLLEYCLKNDLCTGRNIKLPAFLIERFTSFWFHKHTRVGYLSYALLNKFFISDINNKYINILKTPYSFRLYPTILKL